MSEKRMLIVDTEVARKIDENRGDVNRSDFTEPHGLAEHHQRREAAENPEGERGNHAIEHPAAEDLQDHLQKFAPVQPTPGPIRVDPRPQAIRCDQTNGN